MSFTEPLGAPDGGDSFSTSRNLPDLPPPPAYDDDVIDDEKLDNYSAGEDLGEDDLEEVIDDDFEIDDDDDGLVNDVDPEVSTDDRPIAGGSLYD